MDSRSSGSRGAGTTTRKSDLHRLHTDNYQALAEQDLGLADRRTIVAKMILPAGDGLKNTLRHGKFGGCVEAWFSPAGAEPDSIHYRWATNFFVLMARSYGLRVPFPEYLPPNDFSPVAERLARLKKQGIACVVRSHISPSVRIAAAARDLDLDIAGTLFVGGGEALTDYKRSVIESTGAKPYPRYNISEIGPIGYACSQMTGGNCVHLFHDSVAAIAHRRPAPLSEVEVESLLFTTLLPTAPHVLINAEMDDSGVIEPARCDCLFSRLGYSMQVRDIFSFGKLTGQGMTLVGTNIVRILEEVLPKRFGGGPTDFQLVEMEGPSQTRLCFRVSPRVPLQSLDKVKECFLQEVRRYEGGAGASRIWRQSEAIEVVRAEPLVSGRGKVLSLHLLRSHTHTHAT